MPCRDSFLCVTWLTHDSSLCVTSWLIAMRDMTHSWLIAMRDMTHSWLIPKPDMTDSYACHESHDPFTWSIHVIHMHKACLEIRVTWYIDGAVLANILLDTPSSAKQGVPRNILCLYSCNTFPDMPGAYAYDISRRTLF